MQIGTPFIASATVAGTPATITVNCGFRPAVVLVINKTNGHVGLWAYGMTAGHLMVLTGSLDPRTSGGVTPVENTYGSTDGFTFGTLTDFNDTGSEELLFIVMPNGMQT